MITVVVEGDTIVQPNCPLINYPDQMVSSVTEEKRYAIFNTAGHNDMHNDATQNLEGTDATGTTFNDFVSDPSTVLPPVGGRRLEETDSVVPPYYNTATTALEGDNTFDPTATTQAECKRGTLTFSVDSLIDTSAFISIDEQMGVRISIPLGRMSIGA